MSKATYAPAALILIAAAVGAWAAFRPEPPDPVSPPQLEQPRPEPAPASAGEGPAAPAQILPAPEPVRDKQRTDGFIGLPDGTYLPSLNGVQAHARLKWQGPFVGVKHKMIDQDGREWYVLNNGDYVTTVIQSGTDHGRPVQRAIMQHIRRAKALPAQDPGKLRSDR